MGTRLFDITARLFVLAFAMALFVALLLSFAVAARADELRDIVFVSSPSCKVDIVRCARHVYFNGDWSGVELCRGKQCHRFEELFKESPNHE